MRTVDAKAVTRPGYLRGLATLESETNLDSLPVEGEIPPWLSGTLLRNGPAKFEVGEQLLHHWFDGLAMLHRFSFDEGRVSYANSFLRSTAWREAEAGRIACGEFGTERPRSFVKRATMLLKPEFTDNCSAIVARLGDGFIAMGEAPVPLSFDPETLETLGVPCLFPGQHVTAHPHHDPRTGELLALATQFGRRSKYLVFAQKDRATQRVLAEVSVCEPSYMHSFGLSERHIVLTACPFVVNPLQLGLSGRPFIENFRWKPEEGTKFFVIDRSSGKLRGTFDTDAFFAFHHVNVYERGDELLVDQIVYDSPEVIDALYLDELRVSPPSEAVHGRLVRHRIDLVGGGVVEEERSSKMFELPRIDPDRQGKPYRYAYGAAVDTDTGAEPADFLDQLVKVDVESGEIRIWFEPGAYPGEPIFVPSPDPGRDEDDGVLLSVVLDSCGTGSYLLVLDAGSFEELGRAQVPHHIPFGFHGQYFS